MEVNREFELVTWPPLRPARMRCERESVIVVLPASSRFATRSKEEDVARLCCKLRGGPQVAWIAGRSGRSGSNLKQLGDEGSLGPHVASADISNLPLPYHRHHLVVRQRSPRCMETAEAEPWSDQAF